MDRELTRREREEVVDRLIWRAWAKDANRLPKHRKPGEIITTMPPEQRRKLAQLTAADFQHRFIGDWR